MSEGEEDRAVEEVGCLRVEVVVGAPEEEAERVLVGAPILLVEILVGDENGDVQEDGHHLLADLRDLVDHAVERLVPRLVLHGAVDAYALLCENR